VQAAAAAQGWAHGKQEDRTKKEKGLSRNEGEWCQPRRQSTLYAVGYGEPTSVSSSFPAKKKRAKTKREAVKKEAVKKVKKADRETKGSASPRLSPCRVLSGAELVFVKDDLEALENLRKAEAAVASTFYKEWEIENNYTTIKHYNC
jgi:hypothetical protein